MPVLPEDDGSAVIIHESPDDHMTQPIGGAGGRGPAAGSSRSCDVVYAARWNPSSRSPLRTRDSGTVEQDRVGGHPRPRLRSLYQRDGRKNAHEEVRSVRPCGCCRGFAIEG